MGEHSPVAPLWSLSIVSHGHLVSVRRLLADLARFYQPGRFEVVITINDSELDPADDLTRIWPGPLLITRNDRPRGFAANHNSAAQMCRGDLLAILDSDLSFGADPFQVLEQHLLSPGSRLIASPTIVNVRGEVEDNARGLITPAALVRRHVFGGRHRRRVVNDRQPADWIAGLFIAITRQDFAQLQGFDERYFMYCEDADLSIRARNLGFEVAAIRTAPVIHEARRMSARKLRYFLWHATSLLKHWTSSAFWKYLLATKKSRPGNPNQGL
ncbi:MAG: glycosyl transferase family 2 [Hydrocarboniphaga sp.]|nr:glycosyl transferase family 2 [Hydrocarboniphaga sp.]